MCVHMFVMCTSYVHDTTKIRRLYQIPWGWSISQLQAHQCGYWEPNPGPVQQQQMLFTAESPLQI